MLLCALLPLLAPVLCEAPPDLDGPLAVLADALASEPVEEPEATDDGADSAHADAGARDDPPDAPTTEDEGRYGVGEPWATLAECESGDWVDGGASFVAGSARWDWAAPGTEVPPWGTTLHHGGLQFHPDTWAWVAPDVLADPPAHAYDATPAQQVAVGEEVRARQGWQAWPVCSRKVGLR